MSRDRSEADRARADAHLALRSALPSLEGIAGQEALDAVRKRPIDYPFGSGQGDEIAFRAGLKPMFRELLPVSSIAAAAQRLRNAGFLTEVAPRIYGDTKDGWDDTLGDVGPSHPDARQALFVGRDAAALREAAALDQRKTDEADLSLGRLLGYPRCCVEAFLSGSRHRKAPELHRAALGRTEGRPLARLNTLDLAVFHFVPWYPCTLRCALSSAYADRLAAVIAARAPAFVAAIDEALAMHRLMLGDDLQISIDGRFDGQALEVARAVPTAQHRHPRAVLAADEEELVARLVRWLEPGPLRVESDALLRGEQRLPVPFAPLLVPFGPR